MAYNGLIEDFFKSLWEKLMRKKKKKLLEPAPLKKGIGTNAHRKIQEKGKRWKQGNRKGQMTGDR